MAMYVYSAGGDPVGFMFGEFIHELESGEALGKVLGSHVYRLDGTYVGEFFKSMVLAKPVKPYPRAILPVDAPPAARSPGPSFSRRVVMNFGFPDAFHLLLEGRGELELAAE